MSLIRRMMVVCGCVISILTACQEPQTVTEAVTVQVEVPVTVAADTVVATVQIPIEVTRQIFVPVESLAPQLGSPDSPLRLIVAPLFAANATAVRANELATALSERTGFVIDVALPATMAATIDQLCDFAQPSIAIVSPFAYIAAHDRCGAEARATGVRNGYEWGASMILARIDSEFDTLGDLDGASWGVSNSADLTRTLFFQALLASEGIESGELIEFDTDESALIAMYDGEVDFATAPYVPPILPFDERQWVYGEDSPDLWLNTGEFPFRSGIGYPVVIDYPSNGGYQVRDARAGVFDSRNFIFSATEIVSLSQQIPNDAVVYSADLPLGVASTIDRALSEIGAASECAVSLCSSDFFAWEGVAIIDDSFFDSVRFVATELELTEEELLASIELD